METESNLSEQVSSEENGGFSVRDIPAQGFDEEGGSAFVADEVHRKTDSAAVSQVNEALVEMVCVMVSKLAVALTGFQEVGLDNDEVKQLVKLWEPFTPGMSPLATAVLGTTMIVFSKTFLYLNLRRQRNLFEAKPEAVKEGEADG